MEAQGGSRPSPSGWQKPNTIQSIKGLFTMNAKFLTSTIAVALLGAASLSANAAGATTLAHPDGTLSVSGAVSDTTCDLGGTPGANDISVSLATAPIASLAATGDTYGDKEFDINLTGCTTAAQSKAPTVRFDASGVSANGNIKNIATGGGAATNVELRLLDGQNSWAPLNLGTNDPANGAAPASGSGTLKYKVQYIATGAATAGDVQGQIPYEVIYN